MNIALPQDCEHIIDGLIATGRFENSSEVVQAALRMLENERRNIFPPGSLQHLYTQSENDAECKTAKASTLKTESE